MRKILLQGTDCVLEKDGEEMPLFKIVGENNSYTFISNNKPYKICFYDDGNYKISSIEGSEYETV
jgi:hypothetical protein